jgi:hypothetical protein
VWKEMVLAKLEVAFQHSIRETEVNQNSRYSGQTVCQLIGRHSISNLTLNGLNQFVGSVG